jgi:hypothetical protein
MDRELESGTHSPEEWIRLLFGLQASGFSGQLTLSSGHKSRHFLFLQGHATDFWSDFKDESLCRTLAKAKLVEANALLDLTDAEAEIAVLSEEMLSEEKLEAHQIERVETGLKIPLKIRSGTWRGSRLHLQWRPIGLGWRRREAVYPSGPGGDALCGSRQ